MAKYFIWKKFSIQVIKHTKNDFHITSTTASNFKQNFMHFLRSSAIQSWNQPRLKINSLTFYKMNFHTQNVSKKLFFTSIGVRAHPGTRKRKALAFHSSEKKLFGNILSVKIHFVKSQGIYLVSGLVSALNGWTSHLRKCMKFCFVWILKRL